MSCRHYILGGKGDRYFSLVQKKNQRFICLYLLWTMGCSCDPSSQDPVVVIKFEFYAHSARLLRKLDHVLLWMLSTNTGLCQCSISAQACLCIVKKISMTSLYSLPLTRLAQTKTQMLITSSRIVTILLKSFYNL